MSPPSYSPPSPSRSPSASSEASPSFWGRHFNDVHTCAPNHADKGRGKKIVDVIEVQPLRCRGLSLLQERNSTLLLLQFTFEKCYSYLNIRLFINLKQNSNCYGNTVESDSSILCLFPCFARTFGLQKWMTHNCIISVVERGDD